MRISSIIGFCFYHLCSSSTKGHRVLLVLGLQTQWGALALASVMLIAAGRNLVQKGFVGSADFPFSLMVAPLALTLLGS